MDDNYLKVIKQQSDHFIFNVVLKKINLLPEYNNFNVKHLIPRPDA